MRVCESSCSEFSATDKGSNDLTSARNRAAVIEKQGIVATDEYRTERIAQDEAIRTHVSNNVASGRRCTLSRISLAFITTHFLINLFDPGIL